MSESADTWSKIHSDRDWGRWPPESIVSYFCKTWAPAERRFVRVLDLGCGVGACTRFLVDEGFTVTAMDCSEDALTRMRYNLKRWDLPKVTSVCQDVTQPLPFGDAAFDVVLDNLCLTHVAHAERANATSEIHRVLDPRGTFLARRFAVGSVPISGHGEVFYFDDFDTCCYGGLFHGAESWSESARGVNIIGMRMEKCA